MSSEQCDFFDENIIDPLENSVSAHQTVMLIQLSQTCAVKQDVNVNGSPLQIITTGPELLVPAPAQRYLLSINLKQGKNLIIRDKRSGRSTTCMQSPQPVSSCSVWTFLPSVSERILKTGPKGSSPGEEMSYQIFLYLLKECGPSCVVIWLLLKGAPFDKMLHMQCIYVLLISLFMAVGHGEWEMCTCV